MALATRIGLNHKTRLMDIKDFVVIIILFIFADIIFYVVVMKGLMVKSIQGKSHAETLQSQPAPHEGPAFTASLVYHNLRQLSGNSMRGNLAPALYDPAAVMRREAAGLSLGEPRFGAPTDLMVGEPARLELVLQQNIVMPITRALNQAAPAKVTTLKIGARISAQLAGDHFRVTPLAIPEQCLMAPEMRWEWEILPLQAGHHALALELGLALKIPDCEETLHFNWPRCAVDVAPNAYFVLKTFLQRHWKGSLASAGLLAAGLYLWLHG